MDRIKAALLEIDIKAANSSNAYELIMDLMKETASKSQAKSRNDRFLSFGVIGSLKDCE
jgi:hypothetical protein